MRAILDIALNELRLNFKDPGIWLNLVIIPVAISVAVGFANGAGSGGGSSAPRLVVDVIDHDSSALSQQFLADVRAANERIVLCPVDNDDADVCGLGDADLTPENAQQRLEIQTALAQIEIPAGFADSVASGQPASIVYRSNEDITAPSYILQAVQAATQRVGGVQAAVNVASDTVSDLSILQFSDEADRAAFDQRVREQAQTLWESDPVRVDFVQATLDPSTQTGGGEGFSQSIPGIGSMYVMFTVLPLATAIIIERRQWTLQRLVTMPVSRAQILGGKLLSRFVMGMIQFGILFGFGLILGVRYGNDPVALLLLMVAFTLCVTALALVLTTLLQNRAQAEGITLFLSITLAPLGGAWWPLEIVPEWMRIVGHISPIAWVMDGFRSLTFYGGNLGTVAVPILVLLAMAAVLFTFGVVRFKFD
jgi:ABC-2 type transport system permease protein